MKKKKKPKTKHIKKTPQAGPDAWRRAEAHRAQPRLAGSGRAPAPHAPAAQRGATHPAFARPRLLPSAAAGGARGRARAVPGMQRAGGSHQDGGAAGRVWERSGLRPHPASRGEVGPAGRGGEVRARGGLGARSGRARGAAGAALGAAGRRGGRAERGARGARGAPPPPGPGVRGGAGWGGPGGGGRGCPCACGGERGARRVLCGTGPRRGARPGRPRPAATEPPLVGGAAPRSPPGPAGPRETLRGRNGHFLWLRGSACAPLCSHPAAGAWVYIGAGRVPCPVCRPGGGRSADR